MITLICPNCAASLNIDESRQFAFCQYCGTKVTNLNNSIEVNRTTEINNLVLRMLEFEKRGDFTRCAEYCNRILDIDPHNAIAREVEVRLPGYSAGPNIIVVYHSDLDDRYKLRVTLDGRRWEVLSRNETASFELPEGRHVITFSGTKTYKHKIVVKDKKEKITLVYAASRMRNTIQQIT